MTTVEFRNENDGQEIKPTFAADSVISDVKAWAARNGFNQVVFWQEGERMWVQLDEHRLHYWMPEKVFTDGDSEQIEMQLDYARGAQRRSAAGYDRFDQ